MATGPTKGIPGLIAKPRKKHKMGYVKGGVHKLQIFVEETYKDIFQNSSPPPEIHVEHPIHPGR